MSRAFILGNGITRLQVNLNTLKECGPVYGCNAIYREFTPDVLISTDRPISERIQNEGYSLKNRMYTRKPIPGSGAIRVSQTYYGFSSGPLAVAQAALDGNVALYMIGFDMGPINGKFNNVYSDTEFYKKSSAPPTFTGNWVRQVVQICKDFNDRRFFRVKGDVTTDVPELQKITNLVHLPMADFLDRINNTKDL
jgi:hypothetical protein